MATDLSGEDLLEKFKAELDESLENEFRSARTDQGGMYYAESSDIPTLEKTEAMSKPPQKAITAGPTRRYRKKFQHLGWATGDSLTTQKVYTRLDLKWESRDGYPTDAFDGMNIHAELTSKKDKPRLVLLKGCAGSGKTALSRQLARTQPSDDCFFVTVDLVDLASKLPTGGQFTISKIQLIAMSMYISDHRKAHRELTDPNLRSEAELLWASRIPIVWVLDGLAQIASELRASEPLRALIDGFLANDNQLWRHRKKDKVIIASRDGRTAPLSDVLAAVPVATITPWGVDEKANYIEQYFHSDEPQKDPAAGKVVDRVQSGPLATLSGCPVFCECMCSELSGSLDAITSDEDLLRCVLERIYRLPANRRLRALEPDLGFDAVAKLAAQLAPPPEDSLQHFTLGVDANSTQEDKNAAVALVNSGLVQTVKEGDHIGASTYAFIDETVANFFAAMKAPEPEPLIDEDLAREIADEEQECRRQVADKREEEKQREVFCGYETWSEFHKEAVKAQAPRRGFYSVRDDEAVDRFAAGTKYAEVTVAELRQQVGSLYKAKYRRYGSVTRQMMAAGPGMEDEHEDRMLSDNIFTKLTLIEMKRGTIGDAPDPEDDWVDVGDMSPKATPDSPNSPASPISEDGAEVTRLEATSIVDDAVRCTTCRALRRVERCEACRRLLVVEGRAGIGKSTFAMQLGRVQPSESCVFIVLQLGLLESFLPPLDKPGDADLSMLQLLGVALSPFAQNSMDASKDIHQLKGVPKSTIEALWGSRHVPIVWVLDGLDEVSSKADPRIRDFLSQALNTDTQPTRTSFWERRPQDAVIVTSREEKGKFGTYLVKKPTLRIDTWGVEEVKQYVGRYFDADMSVAPPHSAASKSSNVLLSTALGSFARLPITCELVCFVMQQTRADEVPDVAFVYERAVEEIYKNNRPRRMHAAQAREADEPEFRSVDFSQARDAAANWGLVVARRYQELESRHDDHVDQLGLLVVEIPKKDDLSFSLIHSGWLRHVTGDRYQFVHKSFMEYFAARALASDRNELKRFKVDVGLAAQQRNLLVLLTTILVRSNTAADKVAIGVIETAVIESFKRHFRRVQKAVEFKMSTNRRDEIAVLRDRVGCSTVGEIAKVLYQTVKYSKDLTAGQVAGYASLSTPPFPKRGDLECSLMDGIDLCAGFARRLTRLLFSDVPVFYGWMIEPMAQQNALRALMYVQRRIDCNDEHFNALAKKRIYDASLLEAEVAGAKDTAHFLVKHCNARLDLKLAAEIGAAAVLRRDLASHADLVKITGELLVVALRSNQLEAIGAILSVAFENWPGDTSLEEILVDVARCAAVAGVDLESEEMLSAFGRQANLLVNSELDFSGVKPNGGNNATFVVFVLRAVQPNIVHLGHFDVNLPEPLAPSRMRQLLPHLGRIEGLTTLGLHGHITLGDLCAINTTPHVTSLQLTELDDSVSVDSLLRTLFEIFPELQTLGLRGVPMNDSMLAALVPLGSLSSLDLRNTKVTEPQNWEGNAQQLLQDISLVDAASGGYHAACKVLVARGADVNGTNISGSTPLHIAAEHGHRTTCDLLLRLGADVSRSNNYGSLPLFTAARNGHASTCGVLLDYGANVNRLNKRSGSTALYLAAYGGHAAMCELLLIRGADPNLQNSNGSLPLCAAAQNGHSETCTSLLARGADVNRTEKNGLSPLHLAAQEGRTKTTDLLIDSGADLNRTLKNGLTPLYLAAQNGHADTCKLLLARGADVNRRNKAGWTPLSIAAQNGHAAVIALLSSHGASMR